MLWDAQATKLEAVIFGQHLLFAFVGGVILNIMPCVLPVLTLKAFHVVDSVRADPTSARAHGVAYAVGTTASFLALGVLVILLRASGESLGWGMQFQNAGFVAVLTTAIYVFGLNALGVFEISFGIRGGGSSSGLAGSALNGVLASVMSTPCTAPFLGTAAAYAMGTGATTLETLMLFAGIGLGLAAPFVVLTFIPALVRLLPKPGAWMARFKQLMGFTLIATALWLYSVLQAQVTAASASSLLFFLFFLTVALWAVQSFASIQHGPVRRWTVRIAAAATVVLMARTWVSVEPRALAPLAQACAAELDQHAIIQDGHINWLSFEECVMEQARQENRAVLVDFTADWCVSCKALEAAVIETEPVRQTLTETRTLAVKADFTNENAVIERWLNDLGRNAVPAVAVYRPDGTHHLMPVTFSIGQLVQVLEES